MSTIDISPSLARRDHDWASWKEVHTIKHGIHQCAEQGGVYLIWFYDGPEVHVTSLPESGADTTDFEANYLPTANATLEPKAKDWEFDLGGGGLLALLQEPFVDHSLPLFRGEGRELQLHVPGVHLRE